MASRKEHRRAREAIRASLPKSYEFDERDLALLHRAEQQARDIDALEADVR
jgi:hypothetical protein